MTSWKHKSDSIGIRLAIRNEESIILGVKYDGEDDFNLPGFEVEIGNVEEGIVDYLENKIGLHGGEIQKVYEGKDLEFGNCLGFTIICEEDPDPDLIKDAEIAHLTIGDILKGRHGLVARDMFNNAGWMNRPALDLEVVYKICKRAINNGSARATEATDLVIDEMSFLSDIGKYEEIDRILQECNVDRLHADVADAFRVAIEGVPNVKNADNFSERVDRFLEKTDALIRGRKIRMVDSFGNVLSEDVRGDAKKYYRKKAKEFSDLRRKGLLSKEFPGRHRGGDAIKKSVKDDETIDSNSSGMKWLRNKLGLNN